MIQEETDKKPLENAGLKDFLKGLYYGYTLERMMDLFGDGVECATKKGPLILVYYEYDHILWQVRRRYYRVSHVTSCG